MKLIIIITMAIITTLICWYITGIYTVPQNYPDIAIDTTQGIGSPMICQYKTIKPKVKK